MSAKKTTDDKSKDESSSLDSGDAILDWVKGKVIGLAEGYGGKLVGWLAGQVLNELGFKDGPSQLDKIQTTLEEIQETQKNIEKGIKGLMSEVKFQGLMRTKFDHATRIAHRHADLVTLSETKNEAERAKIQGPLLAGILSTNDGAAIGLRAIHDLLTTDTSGDGEGLIDTFMKRWLDAVQKNELEDNFPVSKYPEHARKWLHGLFVVQYMGLVQLVNAYSFNQEPTRLKEIVELTAKRLQQQKDMLESYIPAWTTTVPLLFNGRFHSIREAGSKTVLYGDSGGDHQVLYREAHLHNADEEWCFIPLFKTDTFRMRTRNFNYYAMGQSRSGKDSLAINYKNENHDRLRLVMKDLGETKSTKEKAEEDPQPYRAQLVPVLASLDKQKYLGINKAKHLTYYSKKADAVEIRLDESGYYQDSDPGSEMGKLTAVNLADGRIVFCQGYYGIVHDPEKKTSEASRYLREIFPNTPFDYITAAVLAPGGKYYFFQGTLCAIYDPKAKTSTKENPLREEFPQVVFDHVDAVIPWAKDEVLLVERGEAMVYDLKKRKAVTGPLLLKEQMPNLSFTRIEGGLASGPEQIDLFRRGECVRFDLTKKRAGKPKAILDEWAMAKFETYIKTDGLRLPTVVPASPKEPEAKYFHQDKPQKTSNSGINLTLLIENRLMLTFACKDSGHESGKSSRKKIAPLDRTEFLFVESKFPHTTGPEGWALYEAEENPSVGFRVKWDIHSHSLGAYDSLRFDEMRGCELFSNMKRAPSYLRDYLLKVTVTAKGSI